MVISEINKVWKCDVIKLKVQNYFYFRGLLLDCATRLVYDMIDPEQQTSYI